MKRPATQEELIEYIEWAVPRARQLGTRVTKAEAKAIGFLHGLFRVKAELAAEALAAQKAAAEAPLAP